MFLFHGVYFKNDFQYFLKVFFNPSETSISGETNFHTIVKFEVTFLSKELMGYGFTKITESHEKLEIEKAHFN